MAIFETVLCDCHKLTLTFFKAYFKKRPLKNVEYRRYENFKDALSGLT